MSARQGTRKSKSNNGRRVTVANPLDMLVFLLPLIIFYELVCLFHPQRVIAYNILRHFMLLFGAVGVWAPALVIPVILLATHIVSHKPWKVRWGDVAWMYAESILLAIPLLLLNWTVPLSAADGPPGTLAALAQGIGAGVYEELVFRLVFISLVVLIGSDILGGERRIVGGVAIVLSALLFAAHHHYPVGAEPFQSMRFLFRTVAGLYLATIFWYRGYASAAGCHASYNGMLVLIG